MPTSEALLLPSKEKISNMFVLEVLLLDSSLKHLVFLKNLFRPKTVQFLLNGISSDQLTADVVSPYVGDVMLHHIIRLHVNFLALQIDIGSINNCTG